MSTRESLTRAWEVIGDLRRFPPSETPVMTVYLPIPIDPAELRGVESRLNSLLKPVRELAESDELGHYDRLSLRSDIDRALEAVDRAVALQGRTLGIFACSRADLYEEIVLPRRVRDRLVLDATPYLRPALTVLDEFHSCIAVVVERSRAWLYEFSMGELEQVKRIKGPPVGRRDYGGWHGFDEHRIHQRAETKTRQHFRKTVEAIEDLVNRSQAELLAVGGHEETVAEFRPFLSLELERRMIGTFVVDPHTMTPALVREMVEQIVQGYEERQETELVAEAVERAATNRFGAVGLEWCLLAVDERGVQLLLIHDEVAVPGRACDNCGWLGLRADQCPVCGSPVRDTSDLLEDMAVSVMDAGGRVEHVFADTALSEHQVAALLRFPVPRPEQIGVPGT